MKLARRGQKVPLVPMPIIRESFERIAMDVIGPEDTCEDVATYVTTTHQRMKNAQHGTIVKLVR